MKIDIEAKVSVLTILIKIGFLSVEGRLQYEFGNCKMNAIKGINRYFQEGYNFFGYFISERRAGEIDFFLPLELESYEQGLACLAYYLRNADLKIKPDWLNEGLALKEHLPWERDSKKYNENPKAIIEHEWFRLMVKKTRLLVPTSTEEDVTTFSFDGTILKLVCNNQTFVVSGIGKDWQRTATVKTKSLDFLPKRIPNRDIHIFIWQNKLYFGNRIFELKA